MRPGEERPIGGAERPAHDDRPVERDARRHVDDDAAATTAARVSWANLSSAGSGRSVEQGVVDRADHGHRHADTGGGAPPARATIADPLAFVDLDERVGVVRQASRRRAVAGPVDEPRRRRAAAARRSMYGVYSWLDSAGSAA